MENINICENELYYHYKTLDAYYKIIEIALDEETEKPVIIYQAQYGKKLIWIKKFEKWFEIVEHNVVMIPRFSKVQNKNN